VAISQCMGCILPKVPAGPLLHSCFPAQDAM